MLGKTRKLARASFNIRFILFHAFSAHRRSSARARIVGYRGKREDRGSTSQFPTQGLFFAAEKFNFRTFETPPHPLRRRNSRQYRPLYRSPCLIRIFNQPRPTMHRVNLLRSSGREVVRSDSGEKSGFKASEVEILAATPWPFISHVNSLNELN